MISVARGSVSELAVAAALAAAGYEVAWPIHHAQSYDLIARAPGGNVWITIQVKTARPNSFRNNQVRVDLRRSNGFKGRRKYYAGEVDAFAFALPDDGRAWLVPVARLRHESNLPVDQYGDCLIRPLESKLTTTLNP